VTSNYRSDLLLDVLYGLKDALPEVALRIAVSKLKSLVLAR
jgi:hypothetical protein